MIFSISHSYWFVLVCVLLSAMLTWLLYRKQQSKFPAKVYYLLNVLRFLSLFLISFLLLSPVLKYLTHKTEKPLLIFAQDNSGSLKHAFKKTDSIAYRKQVAALLSYFEDDYAVNQYSFGAQLTDSLKFSYQEPATDISAALETILTNYENDNLGAIILATDGIYNKGISPLSENYPFKGAIYTVGLGDTLTQKDALVARVFANKTIYLGDKFAIRSDIAAYGCEGSQVTISIFSHNQNRNIAVQNVTANSARFSKSIETIVDANVPGVQHYTIAVSKVDGEQNTLNNSQDVYVEVLDSKENVLIVGNAPHPDINALKEALSRNKNYKVDIAMADKAVGNINDYNLIVLHNLPSEAFNANNIIEQAQKTGISLWFIAGSQTAIPLLNKVQTALQIIPRTGGSNDVMGTVNNDFSFFTLSENYSKALAGLPPLSAPFGDFKTGANVQVLMTQKIGSVSTGYPLWVMQPAGNAKVGVLAAEGLWRWRFYDFFQHKNHDAVDDFILKTAQYLSVKHDKKQFRSQLPKSVFTESESVVLDAELYNENYELINTPDVTVALTDENGKRSTFNMNKSGNSYSLNMGSFSAGKYNYACTTAFNGKSYSSGGSFTVVYQNIEDVNTTADFGTLNQLAKNYQGEFVFADQLASLKEKIKSNEHIKSVIRTESQTEPLINWKWLFALLLILLGAEWYLRKTNGAY
ncbi:MAG: hypothetical protein IT257_11730 [Chitinophagaceae bacterium]|nr:hypothetical protein [Chitinophagaceae bacterium]